MAALGMRAARMLRREGECRGRGSVRFAALLGAGATAASTKRAATGYHSRIKLPCCAREPLPHTHNQTPAPPHLKRSGTRKGNRVSMIMMWDTMSVALHHLQLRVCVNIECACLLRLIKGARRVGGPVSQDGTQKGWPCLHHLQLRVGACECVCVWGGA